MSGRMPAADDGVKRFDRRVLLRGAAGAVLLGGLGAAGVGLDKARHRDSVRPHAREAAPGVALFRIRTDEDPREVDLSRYDTVVLHDGFAPLVRRLKERNPKLEVLLYKSAAGIPDPPPHGDWRLSASGVGYRFTQREHPEWFLTGRGNTRLRSTRWDYITWADVGDPTYQRAWLANVTRALRSAGADGVMLDDVNTGRQQVLAQQDGVFAGKYPSYASWSAAVESFLRNVGPRLRRQGHVVLANIGAGAGDRPSHVAHWATLCSGVVQEHFARWDDGARATHPEWLAQMARLRAVIAAGRPPTTLTTGAVDDVETMRFVRACLLLWWTPAVGGATAWESPGVDPYNAAWTRGLGNPTGRPSLTEGIWTRAFTGGSVQVDPVNMRAAFRGV